MADDEGADEPSRLSICAAVPIGTCCEMSAEESCQLLNCGGSTGFGGGSWGRGAPLLHWFCEGTGASRLGACGVAGTVACTCAGAKGGAALLTHTPHQRQVTARRHACIRGRRGSILKHSIEPERGCGTAHRSPAPALRRHDTTHRRRTPTAPHVVAESAPSTSFGHAFTTTTPCSSPVRLSVRHHIGTMSPRGKQAHSSSARKKLLTARKGRTATTHSPRITTTSR